MNFEKIFKNKKIIVTSHTGFKGSWQCFDTKRDIELINQKLTKN